MRRAMAKKKHEVMAKEREYFINGIVQDGKVVVPGAVRNGVDRDTANRIFDEMMDFASYAFNKSHAAAYAVLAYRTAYLEKILPGGVHDSPDEQLHRQGHGQDIRVR